MTDKDWRLVGYIFLGALVAVVGGIVVFGKNPIDVIGDWVAILTTTEETRLQQLEPSTQAAARGLINALSLDGIEVQVGQTLRTRAQEKQVIDEGKSGVKTYSWHEIGRALDLYPVDPETGKVDLDGRNTELFLRMHLRARDYGFRGIAFDEAGFKTYITNKYGKRIWDGGHLQFQGPYANISQAVAAEGSNYGITRTT